MEQGEARAVVECCEVTVTLGRRPPRALQVIPALSMISKRKNVTEK